MIKIKSAIQYLFNQNKVVIGLAVLLAQFPTLADIEWAIITPLVPQSRVPIVIIYTELVACLITFPVLLFAFKVTGRLKQLFGVIPATILFFVALMVENYLNRTGPESRPGSFTLLLTLDLLLFSLILCLILFILKGKSTFFDAKQTEVKAPQKDNNFSEHSQVTSMFCGQCGSPILSTSKFCAKCGIEIVTV